MKIYAARHGETEWNALNKVCGRTDIDLTANGIEQARKLALKAEGKGITVIISSPMIRAVGSMARAKSPSPLNR